MKEKKCNIHLNANLKYVEKIGTALQYDELWSQADENTRKNVYVTFLFSGHTTC